MKLTLTLSALLLLCSTSPAQDIVDSWKYTLRKPAEGWRSPDFDALDWKEANGGFGTRDTPGARVA
ncbi:MAG: hypothetical protein KDB05_24635, partial [Planctomycetales bacterium]|nr:hypothetical protein [Planctomycetales bacterium]